MKIEASPVSETTRRDADALGRCVQRKFASASIWTDAMLAALQNGVQGGKWHSLIDKVFRLDTLALGWAQVEKNAGAAGVDRMSVKRFAQARDRYLAELAHALQDGSYRPQPVRRVYIPKGKGHRPLGIPASLLKVVLDEIGLRSFPKTSGRKGFNVVVPLTRRLGWDEVKGFSHAVAKHMAHVRPDRFSAVLGPKNRVGKIFVDYLRNGRGASTVAPFSVRARPGMEVSVPVSWDELKDVERGDRWTMRKAVERQRSLGADPWDDYWRKPQGITAAMRRAVGMKTV
jgi:hypothetical protein